MCISSLTSIFHHLPCSTPLLLIPIYQYTECLTCKTFGGKFLPGISFWSSHPTCFIISFFQGWRHSQCIINRLDERPLVETFPNEEKEKCDQLVILPLLSPWTLLRKILLFSLDLSLLSNKRMHGGKIGRANIGWFFSFKLWWKHLNNIRWH